MTYKNHRVEPYFTYVKNGQKTIEGRIKKGKYQRIKPNDFIIVFNSDETDSIKVKVKDVRSYSSFQEMLEKEPIKKVLPDVDSVDQGLAVYRKFYNEEQEKRFGVIAIEVERITK